MLTASFHSAFPADGNVPEWVHLLPAGTFRGMDGRGPYHLRDAQAVMNASMAAGKVPLDESHSTMLSVQTGIAAPARGWIVEMQSRDDGIWGRVEWTPTGTQLMQERAYRGLSPVFDHTKDGTVVRIRNAALTNNPNLLQLTTLHTRQETQMDLAQLRAALGLPETADEAAVLAAVTANAGAVARHAQQITALAAAAGVTATTEAQLITALQTARGAQTEVAAMAAQVVTLQGQLQTMQAQQSRAAAEAFVDGAIKLGHPIAPLRDHYIARHMAAPADVEKEIKGMPSIHAGGFPSTQPRAAANAEEDPLTETDMHVAKLMGQTPEAFAKNKRAQRLAREGSAG